MTQNLIIRGVAILRGIVLRMKPSHPKEHLVALSLPLHEVCMEYQDREMGIWLELMQDIFQISLGIVEYHISISQQ